MEIFVKLLTSETITLNVSPDTTIDEIKRLVQLETGKLYRRHKNLNDKITPGEIIYEVLHN